MIPNVGATELIVLLVVVLLLFGAKRIPELARSLGTGLKEFKKGVRVDAHEEELVPPDLGGKEPPKETPAKHKPSVEDSIPA